MEQQTISTQVEAVRRSLQSSKQQCDKLQTRSKTLDPFLSDSHGCRTTLVAGAHPERCITSKRSPTIRTVAEQYGAEQAKGWLMMHISYCTTADAKITPDTQQLADTATALLNEYGFLKLSEWLLFFYRFSNGEYEQFYGTFSRQAVMRSVKRFCEQRAFILDRIEQKQREEARDKAAQTAISWEEYQARKTRMQKEAL